MLNKHNVSYRDQQTVFEGYYSFDDSIPGKRPAVLVAHDWTGKNRLACDKADQLAAMGYLGFALDMYGNGKTGQTKEEKMALISPLMQDRALLQKRILAAYHTVKSLDEVDAANIGAIGFCFGGLCVLDLARTGADVKGVVSFHGLLNPPEHRSNQSIQSKMLVLHGFDDPMVTPDHVIAFGQEMTHAKADWQLTMYGQTMHAFSNPEANDPGFGTVYSKTADRRSWAAMQAFFEEVFSKMHYSNS